MDAHQASKMETDAEAAAKLRGAGVGIRIISIDRLRRILIDLRLGRDRDVAGADRPLLGRRRLSRGQGQRGRIVLAKANRIVLSLRARAGKGRCSRDRRGFYFGGLWLLLGLDLRRVDGLRQRGAQGERRESRDQKDKKFRPHAAPRSPVNFWNRPAFGRICAEKLKRFVARGEA